MFVDSSGRRSKWTGRLVALAAALALAYLLIFVVELTRSPWLPGVGLPGLHINHPRSAAGVAPAVTDPVDYSRLHTGTLPAPPAPPPGPPVAVLAPPPAGVLPSAPPVVYPAPPPPTASHRPQSRSRSTQHASPVAPSRRSPVHSGTSSPVHSSTSSPVRSGTSSMSGSGPRSSQLGSPRPSIGSTAPGSTQNYGRMTVRAGRQAPDSRQGGSRPVHHSGAPRPLSPPAKAHR